MEQLGLSPTTEHLNDPYVIQLIETISRLDDRIEDLEEGACRFNCRTKRDAFMSGARAAIDYESCGTRDIGQDALERLFKEWKSAKQD